MFLSIAFVAQICGGIGAGLNTTTSLAILTSMYPDEREKMMGLFEAATGLGFLFGPMIGSAFYSIGGYIAPFFGICLGQLILYPFLMIMTQRIEIF